jgi:hypothetical protein
MYLLSEQLKNWIKTNFGKKNEETVQQETAH